MNLQQTISKITGLTVSEEDAMCYASDQFGVLASYLKHEERKTIKELINDKASYCNEIERLKSRIKELETEKESAYKLFNKASTENKEYREVLEDIVLWDIDTEYSINFGSNGVRDYFRQKAKKVLDLNRGEIKLTTGEEIQDSIDLDSWSK